ncbi:MAG: subunit 1 of alternative cytochrome bd quinol oxidase (CydA) [Candidatus Scalindua rubra]|uniref:Subunit 1 of alternative cytochrome bd quinol oxidase (CydA) n=1 Tax=Candidatus Scalindua rubra TaxID=1872076 RepID=A0A1E3XDL7_9BACT|nr:MAG: subunit 1 of alternative cytochrome bd quinol oxidase (CydA) [Candidatus Scalindua rubra]
MKNKFPFYIFYVASILIILFHSSAPSLAQPFTDITTNYREFPSIGSRIALWIVAQLHLNFAAFILGVPIFSAIVELIGICTKNPQYDRTAKEFIKLTLMALTTTAIFGALLTFFLISLYPGLFNYLTSIFSTTFWIYPLLFFGETASLYLYWYTWDKLSNRKLLHLFLGIILNIFGISIMFTANSWVSFMISPSGIDEQGILLNTWNAITNFTWMPLNIHRFIGNISFGGAIVAAYAGFKFMISRTDDERAHYDWMGYTGNIIAIMAFMILPFAGYWLTKEIYAFSEQLGVILMGGFLSWLWIIQALVIGILFLGTNCYFWIGMERIPGAERYKKYIKYLVLIVTLCFLIWATPHTLVATHEETHRMGGSHHPVVGVLGLMSAKNTAVNMMIMATFISFIIYRRGNKISTVNWSSRGSKIQKLIIFAACGVVIFYGVYGYFVEAITRVGFSIFQVSSVLLCIILVAVIDLFLFRNAKIIGRIRWGEIPSRSQYALLSIGVTYVWLMGLMGFARSAMRQHWHVYGILKDTSSHAYTPALGYTANLVSIITILFIAFILFIFWISSLGEKNKNNHEKTYTQKKPKGQNPKTVLLKGMLFSAALIGFLTLYSNKIPQIESRVPEDVVVLEQELTQEKIVRIGKDIFQGKGNCYVCHLEAGGRGPNLEDIGLTAETRETGISSKDYLMESLIQPMAYLVKGFEPIMPLANKPPVSLNHGELLAVVAYLQSLGGVVTITPTDIPVGAFAPVTAKEIILTRGNISAGKLVFEDKGCAVCHKIVAEEGAELAPNLFDIGDRADIEFIKESIIDPSAKTVEGYDLAMPEYEEELTIKEFNDLIAYLQSFKGKKLIK